MGIVEFASQWAKRCLSPRRVESLRGAYLAGKSRLAPALRLVHGHFGVAELRAHLEQHIGHDFEILMVHSSLNGMQPMYDGGALETVRMLADYCGPGRTLVMPAFYFGENGEGARAAFERNPRFDLTRTPSQMGLMTELFRRLPGVRQSRHPVYRMAALGPLAEALTNGHEHAPSPAGRGSPFDFMDKRNTYILGLGKPVEVLTHVHLTEESMGDEFPVPSRESLPLPMTLVERGVEMPFVLRSRVVDGDLDMWRVRKLMAPGTLHEWSFHHVPMFSTRAADVTRQLIDAARRGQTLYRA
jgi:aminoglycoside 3-N-acetyltransferase